MEMPPSQGSVGSNEEARHLFGNLTDLKVTLKQHQEKLPILKNSFFLVFQMMT